MASIRDFPGFSDVYQVGDPVSNRPFRVDFPEEWIERKLQLTRGEVRPGGPLVLRHFMGASQPRDVIWTGAAGVMIVHARVLDVLLDHRFTGWATYPVEVHGKRGDVFAEYHGLAFTGRCGPVQFWGESLFQKQFPAMAVPYYRGLYFDVATWDGSDLFAPVPINGRGKETAHKFALGSVARALRKAKVGNILLRRALDYETHASWVRPEDVITVAPEA
jgi:hypothetical protein